ncbi:MAG: hypothetical protein R2873_20345 [Caldilineaceae bacterium]
MSRCTVRGSWRAWPWPRRKAEASPSAPTAPKTSAPSAPPWTCPSSACSKTTFRLRRLHHAQHGARAVVAAGTDIVAIDATARSRPQPGTLADYIAAIHEETGRPVLADISTLEEGIAAEAAGADFISTTMSGYTPYSPQQADPDLDLVRQLAARLRVPLLAEGRYRTPEQVRAALDAGALAAIVGGAITRPQEITRWFVEGIRNA